MTRPRIVVAPDSFKGTLSAAQAAEAMERAARRAIPEADVHRIPLADGGEGTLEILLDNLGGETCRQEVTGPAGKPVTARFGLLPGGETAIVEMAEASGLTLVPPEERDPMRATTYGTGELIRAALDRGAGRVEIGLGGSATVDGGLGMAQALGAGILSRGGGPLPRGGGALEDLGEIQPGSIDRRILGTEFVGLTDVHNPLLGEVGAARIYGPQKGATPDQVEVLERGLRRYREIALKWRPRMSEEAPGDGAAGGLGFGLRFFLGARLQSGARYVLDAVRFSERIAGADLVITGEGKIDHQTLSGKVAGEVIEACGIAGVPCWVVGGQVERFTAVGSPGRVRVRALPAGRGGEKRERAGPVLEEAVRGWLEDCRKKGTVTFL